MDCRLTQCNSSRGGSAPIDWNMGDEGKFRTLPYAPPATQGRDRIGDGNWNPRQCCPGSGSAGRGLEELLKSMIQMMLQLTRQLIARLFGSQEGASEASGIGGVNGALWSSRPAQRSRGGTNESSDARSVSGKGGSLMAIARRETGVTEIYGSRSNPRINAYHASTGNPGGDDIAWCASFVNWVLKQGGHPGTKSRYAISFKDYGAGVAGGLKSARPGDIVVLHNPSLKTKDSSGNHVAFFVRNENGRVVLLGGNQSDKVKESTYNLGSWQVVAVRRPEKSAVMV